MRFTFKFSNDFGEPADVCIRCGADTRERSLVCFPGARILIYACQPCLYELAHFVWWFHEAPLRAVLHYREKKDAGESLIEYENAFTWHGGNGSPRPALKSEEKCRSIGRKNLNRKKNRLPGL
ncbi:MAG: hypothetical protein L0Z48_10630 [candidate division Zixibacteria bacterium]|nr:hypothetical protein [candidate division Zixibacteria bacterium]